LLKNLTYLAIVFFTYPFSNQNAKTLGRQLARAKDKLTEEKRRHATTVTEKDRYDTI
jgi:hypothetical protein